MSTHGYGRILQTLKNGDIPDGITCQMRIAPNADDPNLQGDIPRGLYVKFSDGTEEYIGGGEGVSGIQLVETTYNDLDIVVNNNLLVAGNFYKITIQTKFVIPASSTSEIYTGEEEVLYLQAVSGNKFNTRVMSETFPQDIIDYDFDLNLCEDGATPRTGKIIFRHDTNNNQAPFDTRELRVATYNIDKDGYDSWDTGVAYSLNKIVNNGPNTYRCIRDHVSGLTFNEDNTVPNCYWAICDINGMYVWAESDSVLGGTIFTTNGETVVKVFENSYNCSIQKVTMGNVYGNISMVNSNSISTGIDCINLRIYESINCKIGVSSSSTTLYSVNAVDFKQSLYDSIFVSSSAFVAGTAMISCYFFNVARSTFGDSVNSVSIRNNTGTSGVTMGSNVSGCYLNGTDSVVIKDYAAYIVLDEKTLSSELKYVTIGYNTSGVLIVSPIDNVTIGDNCGESVSGGGVANRICVSETTTTGLALNSYGLTIGNTTKGITFIGDLKNVNIGSNSRDMSFNANIDRMSIGDNSINVSATSVTAGLRSLIGIEIGANANTVRFVDSDFLVVKIGSDALNIYFNRPNQITVTQYFYVTIGVACSGIFYGIVASKFGDGCVISVGGVDANIESSSFGDYISMTLNNSFRIVRCSFVNPIQAITINNNLNNVNFSMGSAGLVVNNPHTFVSVNSQSPDNSFWYTATSNAGVATQVKFD